MPRNPYVETVENKGWSLYDVSDEVAQTETWEERERRRKPVETIEESGMYFFVPQPEPNQSLREAYAVTKGLGPCLRIRDVDSPEYKILGLRFSPRLAVFTRLVFQQSEIGLFTPFTEELPESDFVVLAAPTAEDTFRDGFDIISPEDFQRETEYTAAEWHVEKA